MFYLINFSTNLIDDNKVKFMNGASFFGLISAVTVKLHNNVCIDEDFLNGHEVATMGPFVTEQCGSHDWHKELAEKIHEIDGLLDEIKKRTKDIASLA